MDVSHPDSPEYGKYYTPEQVNEFFAPTAERAEIVREWLQASGVSGHRVSQPANKAWLQFHADAEEVAELLKTKYHIFEHADTGSKKVACDDHGDSVMTPTCVFALYNLTKPNKAYPDNQLGIYEFADQYNQFDVDRCFRDFAPEIPNGTHPDVKSVDGGVAPGPQGARFESYLDLQIAYPLLHPQGITLY
ncbi:hypothetical protein Hte_006386 [Hypoxylon texense]